MVLPLLLKLQRPLEIKLLSHPFNDLQVANPKTALLTVPLSPRARRFTRRFQSEIYQVIVRSVPAEIQRPISQRISIASQFRG